MSIVPLFEGPIAATETQPDLLLALFKEAAETARRRNLAAVVLLR